MVSTYQTITLNDSRIGHPTRRTTLLNPMASEPQPGSPPSYPSFDLSHYTTEDLAPPIEQFMEGTSHARDFDLKRNFVLTFLSILQVM